jgi:hypothetical protein
MDHYNQYSYLYLWNANRIKTKINEVKQFLVSYKPTIFAKYQLNTSLNTLIEIPVLKMDEIERIENKLFNCYDEENDPQSQV